MIIELPFAPQNLLADCVELALPFGTVRFHHGMATLEVSDGSDAHDEAFIQRLRRSVSAFLSVQAGLRGTAFRLESERIVEVRDDGKRNYFIKLEAAVATASAGTLDITITDSSGRVVRDSRLERQRRSLDLATLCAKACAKEPACAALLASYSASFADPDHSLARLYEIRDALSSHFGNERIAREKLGITYSDWTRLGELANGLPLLQGRHRGRFEVLRPATESELTEARHIALRLVEKFARFVVDQEQIA